VGQAAYYPSNRILESAPWGEAQGWTATVYNEYPFTATYYVWVICASV